jgi:hypothetical protein
LSNIHYLPIAVLLVAAIFNGGSIFSSQPTCFTLSPNGQSFTCPNGTLTTTTNCGGDYHCISVFCGTEGLLNLPNFGCILDCYISQSLCNVTVQTLINNINGSSPLTVITKATTNYVFSSGTTGYVSILVVSIAAVVLTGITVLGIGLNPAAVFILFISGFWLALWTTLSVIAGPVFTSLPTITFYNNPTLNGGSYGILTLNLGDIIYGFLSLWFIIGIIAQIAGA